MLGQCQFSGLPDTIWKPAWDRKCKDVFVARACWLSISSHRMHRIPGLHLRNHDLASLIKILATSVEVPSAQNQPIRQAPQGIAAELESTDLFD